MVIYGYKVYRNSFMIKLFFKDSSIYTVSSFINKVIVLVLSIIYMNGLTPEEFGVIEFLIPLGAIINSMLSIEIYQSLLRYVSDVKIRKFDSDKYIFTSISYFAVIYFLFLMVIYFFSDSISHLLFDNDVNGSFLLFWCGQLVTSSFLKLLSVIYRAKLKSLKSVAPLVFSSILNVSSLVAYLSFESLNIEIVYIFSFFSQILVLIFFVNFNFNFGSVSFLHFKVLTSFSFPLVFSSMGMMALMFGDRLIVKEFLSLELLGDFSANYKIAAVATLIVTGFQSALVPLIYRFYHKAWFYNKIKMIFILYLLFSVFTVLFIYLYGGDFLFLISNGQYLIIPEVMTLLGASVLLFGLAMFFPGLAILKKTKEIAYINITCVIFNISCSIFLVSDYQLIGVSFGTLLGSVVYLFLNGYFSEKYLPIYSSKKQV